jgi:hypothetical protein
MLHTQDIGHSMSSAIQNSQKSFAFFLPLLVSALIILFWLIPLAATTLRGKGSGAGMWGLFEIIALLATIIAPIVYGWKTCDTKGAVLIGVLPILFVMTVPRIVSGELPWDAPLFMHTVLTIAMLCIIGGLEGYFASLHEKKSLVLAIVLAGLWIFVFLSAIE